MSTIARVKITKGDCELPTRIKVQFTSECWNIMINNNSPLTKYSNLSDSEVLKYELREAIRKVCNLMEQDLREAVRDQLGINL